MQFESGPQSVEPSLAPERQPDAETVQYYLDDLNLSWEELAGKNVIDIGAGLADFARAAKEHGVRVVSIEAFPDEWKDEGTPPTDVEYIVADATNLQKANPPIADNSFELLVSRAGPLVNTESEADLHLMLAEALRVVKPGGELRFGPAPINPHVVGWDTIISQEEVDTIPEAERNARILAATDAYMTKLLPGVERIPMKHTKREEPMTSFYRYQKPLDIEQDRTSDGH